MQEGNPHNTTWIKKWFQDNDIELLEGSFSAPDLNLIKESEEYQKKERMASKKITTTDHTKKAKMKI